MIWLHLESFLASGGQRNSNATIKNILDQLFVGFAMLLGNGKKVIVRKEIRDHANPTDNTIAEAILHNDRTVFSFTPSAARSRGVSPLKMTVKNARRSFRTIGRVLCFAVERELGAQSFRGNTE
jgi:hypothetical protein